GSATAAVCSSSTRTCRGMSCSCSPSCESRCSSCSPSHVSSPWSCDRSCSSAATWIHCPYRSGLCSWSGSTRGDSLSLISPVPLCWLLPFSTPTTRLPFQVCQQLPALTKRKPLFRGLPETGTHFAKRIRSADRTPVVAGSRKESEEMPSKQRDKAGGTFDKLRGRI